MKIRFLFLLIICQHLKILFAQDSSPCDQSRKICPNQNVKYCHEFLAYDELTNLYLLRKDYSTPYTGSCVSCYPSFIIEEKLNFKDGKRDGTDTSYYKTGCIQSIQTYSLGLEQGPTRIYYDSLNIIHFEIGYQEGKYHGASIRFSTNGDTLMFKHYKNGIFDGPQRFYFPDGKLRKTCFYQNGLLEGAETTFGHNGQMECLLEFKKGKKHGAWSYYFESGKLARRENYKDGKKNGAFITYNELGQIMQTESFNMDMPIDLHQTFYNDGKLKYSCRYSNKGAKVEEYFIDEYGVKKQLFPEKN